MKVRTIIVWTWTSSIIVKQGQTIRSHVSPRLTCEQMCELRVLLYTSLGYMISRPKVRSPCSMGHIGHSQQEHETSHGNMSNVRWSVDALDEEGLEVQGRRFSTNDEGAPMMCSLVCRALGRHVHIDYCRAKTSDECRGNSEAQHITKKLRPDPDRPKDFLTHNLFWKRSGKSITDTCPLQCLIV